MVFVTLLCLMGVLVLGVRGTAAAPAPDSLVQTAYGPVSGRSMTVFNGEFARAINVWHSIPYARAPVGNLRFKSPVEPEPWTEVLDCSEQGPICIQNIPGVMWVTNPLWTDIDEDCLHLNVLAPYDTSRGPYPVMVWIHGGGFNAGANIQYSGHFLATYDVIIVLANYRLADFGFLYTADDVVPGNAGMYDQKMALEWVQTNIAAFGGDPDQVTIFGQSAGGVSVSLLQVSPLTQHLFHQVIAQSGSDVVPWAIANPAAKPERYAVHLAEALDCPTNNTTDMVECLQDKPWRRIRGANITCEPGEWCYPPGPVLDGPGRFMPTWPRILRERGEFGRQPLMGSIARDEGGLNGLEYAFPNPMHPEGLDRYNFTVEVKQLLKRYAGYLPQETFDLLWRQVDWSYAPWPYLNDKLQNLDAMIEMSTDFSFGAGWDYQLKMHQLAAPIHAFVFNFKSPNATNVPDWMGVFHTAELPYVFGYPLIQLNEDVRNDSHMWDPIDWNLDDIKMAVYFQNMITNYAKYGDPTPQPQPNPFDDGETTWLEWQWGDMQTLMVETHPSMVTQFRQKIYPLFDYLIPTSTGFMIDTSMVLAPAGPDAASLPVGYPAPPTQPAGLHPLYRLLFDPAMVDIMENIADHLD